MCVFDNSLSKDYIDLYRGNLEKIRFLFTGKDACSEIVLETILKKGWKRFSGVVSLTK